MELFTTAQYRRLLRNGDLLLFGKDRRPVVKLFTPDGQATWLLTEIDPCKPEMAFGLCDLRSGFPELGYVNLFELTPLGGWLCSPVERDRCFKATYPISVYAEAAKRAGVITEDPTALQAALSILNGS